jgi:BolA family transcriptional regulator, general stress-responsive regulator
MNEGFPMQTAPLSPAVQAIADKLQTELDTHDVVIVDESWQHAGHSGAGGGSHLHITVSSPKFVGLSLLDQHRLVQQVLAPEMQHTIHALVLKTKTPVQ